MKASVESTQVLLMLDGVPTRMWKGVTDGGIPFTLFVHRVVVDRRDDETVFQAELIPQPDTALIAGTPADVLAARGDATTSDN